ncbi:MAG: hypothetical protein AAFQ68_22960, partial [Bacteroidota bacterium]
GGLMARWPLKLIPSDKMAECKDRMDIIGRNYFGTMSAEPDPNKMSIDSNSVFQRAYPYLWHKTGYDLPLFFTNTSRVEDGSKGIMHPLDPKDIDKIFGGVMDLTYKTEEGSQKGISFGDALMMTNRFPVFSPMAKVNGRGHFVDAGAVDNSGKGTILQLLQYMRQKSLEKPDATNDYWKFFEQNKVVLISIRCDKLRYYYGTFKQFVGKMTKTKQEYYLPSYLGGAVNTGLTGNPRAFEGLLDNMTARKSLGLNAQVINLSIPFYIESVEDIFGVLGSEVPDTSTVYKDMDTLRMKKNRNLWKELGLQDSIKFLGEKKLDAARPTLLEPPLARILSKSSREYMDAIARYKADTFATMLVNSMHPDTNPDSAQSNPKDSHTNPQKQQPSHSSPPLEDVPK